METIPVHAQLALSFNEWATRHLESLGQDCSQRRVAHIVGENPGNYSAALKGLRGGSVERVRRWLERWEDADYPPLVIKVRPEGAMVEGRLCWEPSPGNETHCWRPTGHGGTHQGTRAVAIRTGYENILERGLVSWE